MLFIDNNTRTAILAANAADAFCFIGTLFIYYRVVKNNTKPTLTMHLKITKEERVSYEVLLKQVSIINEKIKQTGISRMHLVV